MTRVPQKPIIPHKLRLGMMVTSVLLLFIALLVTGILPRQLRAREMTQTVKPQSTRVSAVRPKLSAPVYQVQLPGEVSAYLQTSIYSRISGTLKTRLADIGDYVRAGQILATVDVPELDQELNQAKANLQQAQANVTLERAKMELAKTSLNRWLENARIGGVSQQDIAQRQSDFKSAQAGLQAAQAAVTQNQANIRRILALQSYKNILAPFSGFITERNVDPGANVVSGGSVTSTNLFTIAQKDRLRIFIHVPQSETPWIRKGMAVDVSVSEYPHQTFIGHITRLAEALEPKSRTLLTEILLPNARYQLYPGMFSQVNLSVRNSGKIWTIPDTALVINAAGIRVIVIQPDHRLHYQPVAIGRDFGSEAQVQSGLKGNEMLVANATDSLQEGEAVEVMGGL